ncbi:MAG: asparagine synthase (glutamine-hydrolyzing) [Patescibacteria group bacterium]|jgi:asparagine synthase (glutamine-hydrolysing)
MCGIAGILNFNNITPDRELIKNMAHELRHRGPDGDGFYFDDHVALGHRRLAIIDLSENGKQPMSNEDGSIWMIFNGEIYNYKDIKNDLKSKGHKFKSDTDCEVVIHAYEEYGPDFVKLFNGMWAFVIWNVREKKLFASRDRLGVKPFYYYLDNNRFVFASEIRAILVDKSIPRIPNDKIIFDYLAFENSEYIDHVEDTFFSGIKKLMPAHNMVIDTKEDVRTIRYWDLDGKHKINRISDDEAASRFYGLFEDAVRLRLQSDVPVGTGLSGGLDSSAIVCVINQLIAQTKSEAASVGARQKTFSACFREKYCDESEYFESVIQQTNVDAYKIYPSDENLFGCVGKFISDQGEPVSSTSQWASWLVMRLASKNGVKVVLNGQGADEILSGYSAYFFANAKDIARSLNFKRLFKEIKCISTNHDYPEKWIRNQIIDEYLPFHPLRWAKQINGPDIAVFPAWLNKDFKVKFAHKKSLKKWSQTYLDSSLFHFLTYERLPSLLRFEDRNSMAFSIEARLPFLDYRLVEYCFSLPAEQKIRNGVGKIVLRNALKDILPSNVTNRVKKIGFMTPEREWLGEKYISEIREIINSKTFKKRDYFEPEQITKHYEGYIKGLPVNPRPIWKYLNLELWFRNCLEV